MRATPHPVNVAFVGLLAALFGSLALAAVPVLFVAMGPWIRWLLD